MNIRCLKISIAFLFATTLLGNLTAKAQDCNFLEPWLTQGHRAIPSNATHGERVASAQMEYTLRVQAGNALEALYRSGELNSSNLNSCLAGLPDRQNFLETFYYVMFSSSLERLEAARSSSIAALMNIFHKKYGQAVPVFRVLGSFQEQDPSPLPAGVQRGTDSLYMNFAEINPDDWLVIFVHETLHAVDDQIFVGVEGYADQTVPKRMASLSSQISSSSMLSTTDLQDLDQWLMFGLDRGLLAEYRAWSATFEIYQDGLREGLWSHRPWLDAIISQRQNNESLERFTYLFLDSRSVDPTDGIFSNPIVASGLKDLRLELRESQTSPSLYGLAPILLGK